MSGSAPGCNDGDLPEPWRLRQLRWLVNALTITLILGFLVIVATLVIRMTAPVPPLALPDTIHLPEGERALGVTFGGDWLAVVTVDGDELQRIRVLDRETGAERSVVPIMTGD
jgi:hypothetical protein